jgi:DNA polymerase-3 subunit gamma/tau
MEAVSLNLSRKWRSQNFDQIIGQDLTIRILKNSLYSGNYFPVYLFAGQRGCGKTSTARVFAAALNCQQLINFQKDPKNCSIPCLICTSCIAMHGGKHPDFIEIDAASYTGVDHMRNIIEASSLLPIMGRKRVYLIDEAHMLSKAAFNAALKILEEPPATALFILATTNPHKIIDTVRSRCFQLFFTPIAHDSLKNHLHAICTQEAIMYDSDALDLIIRHTQGSARDALNVLEQVRFSSIAVDKKAVLQLLGHMNDQQVLDIIKTTLCGSEPELLHLFSALHVDNYAADFVWQRIITIVRGLIWYKHGVNPASFISQDIILQNVAQLCSLSDLQRMVEWFYEHEELFLKTPLQHALLEMILLQLCQKNKKKSDNNGGSAPLSISQSDIDNGISQEIEELDEDNDVLDYIQKWSTFVDYTVTLQDPLIHSLFKRAYFIGYDETIKKITLACAKDLVLFKDWFNNTNAAWQPMLKKLFSSEVYIEMQFTVAVAEKKPVQLKSSSSVIGEKIQPKIVPATPIREQFVGVQQQSYKKRSIVSVQAQEKICDVSDSTKWKTAAMLLRHFPGVITEIRENR